MRRLAQRLRASHLRLCLEPVLLLVTQVVTQLANCLRLRFSAGLSGLQFPLQTSHLCLVKITFLLRPCKSLAVAISAGRHDVPRLANQRHLVRRPPRAVKTQAAHRPRGPKDKRPNGRQRLAHNINTVDRCHHVADANAAVTLGRRLANEGHNSNAVTGNACTERV